MAKNYTGLKGFVGDNMKTCLCVWDAIVNELMNLTGVNLMRTHSNIVKY